MDLTAVLATLHPTQRRAVELVYFERRSSGEVATLLAIERNAVATALAAAFRCVARWVMSDSPDDDVTPTSFPVTPVSAISTLPARPSWAGEPPADRSMIVVPSAS